MVIYDRAFAANRFDYPGRSQRFAANHTADYYKLGWCKSGRHNRVYRAVNLRS
jgi:hypothetical protein